MVEAQGGTGKAADTFKALGISVTDSSGHLKGADAVMMEVAKSRESLANESEALAAYYQLLELTQGKSVLLEDYARNLIVQEEMHADEVNKMLRHTGKTGVYEP